MKQRLRHNSSAFTLLETMVATAVAITVLGGGVAMDRSLTNSKRIIEERATADTLANEGIEAVYAYQAANPTLTFKKLVDPNSKFNWDGGTSLPFFLYDLKKTPETYTQNLSTCTAPKAVPYVPPNPWYTPPPPTPGPEPCTNFIVTTGYGFVSAECPGSPVKGECISGSVSFLSHQAIDPTTRVSISHRRFYSVKKIDLGNADFSSYAVTVKVASTTSDVVSERTVILSDRQ